MCPSSCRLLLVKQHIGLAVHAVWLEISILTGCLFWGYCNSIFLLSFFVKPAQSQMLSMMKLLKPLQLRSYEFWRQSEISKYISWIAITLSEPDNCMPEQGRAIHLDINRLAWSHPHAASEMNALGQCFHITVFGLPGIVWSNKTKLDLVWVLSLLYVHLPH